MVLMRKVATLAGASLLVGIAASADTHRAGVGLFGVAPGFHLGGSLALYNFLSIVGAEGSVYGWSEKQDGGHTRYEIGASLGLNAEVLANLYPSLGVTVTGAQTSGIVFQRQQGKCPEYHGETHCPIAPRTEIEHEDTRWGLEAKLTYVMLDGWLGITAGYRMTFDDPLAHQALFGASVVLSLRPEKQR